MPGRLILSGPTHDQLSLMGDLRRCPLAVTSWWDPGGAMNGRSVEWLVDEILV